LVEGVLFTDDVYGVDCSDVGLALNFKELDVFSFTKFTGSPVMVFALETCGVEFIGLFLES